MTALFCHPSNSAPRFVFHVVARSTSRFPLHYRQRRGDRRRFRPRQKRGDACRELFRRGSWPDVCHRVEQRRLIFAALTSTKGRF